MEGNGRRTAGHDKLQRLMVSLKACSDVARSVDPALCARACRGQIRESGEQSLDVVGELEEIRCTLAGVCLLLAGVSLRPYRLDARFRQIRDC